MNKIINECMVNTSLRTIYPQNNYIGVEGENEITKLVFKFDVWQNGEGRLETRSGDTTHYLIMQKDIENEQYYVLITNSLLVDKTSIDLQLRVVGQDNATVFKSKIFTLQILEGINATQEIPVDQPEWVDYVDEELLRLEEEKVDKVEGKELSTNDFTDTYKNNVDENTTAKHTHNNKNILDNTTASFTTQDKNKLENLENYDDSEIKQDIEGLEGDVEGLEINKADRTEIPTKTNDLTNDSGYIDNTVDDLINYELKTDTGNSIALSIDPLTYTMTLQLKNSVGSILSTANIDLPLESMIVNASYSNGILTLTLQNGQTLDIDISSIVSGLVSEETFNTTIATINVSLSNKVDKITGKSLIEDAKITKLDGIEDYAEVNTVDDVQVDGVSVVTNKVANIDLSSKMDIIDAALKSHDDSLLLKADLVDGKVPSSQLPGYVDDVIDLLKLSSSAPATCVSGDKYYNTTSKKIFTATGTNTWGTNGVTPENGKIYVSLENNKTYRWSGTAMVEISESLALGETSNTAYRGDRGKTAYDHSQATGNPHGTTAANVGAAPSSHVSDSIFANSNGIHGIRYYQDKLAVYDTENEEWFEIKTGGGGGLAPGNVSNISISPGSGIVKIRFNDPSDDVWAGTKVLMKAGSYPSNETDGTVILDNTTRDAYANADFTQSGLTNGTTYYFAFFPYSAEGAYNYNVENTGTGTPVAYKTMGVRIDLSNSNPSTCITYTDDAVNMVAGNSAWDTFFGHYPCILKNGVEGVKLNPNNFGQDVDGNTVNLASDSVGDVMIAFPRRGLKITTTGNYLDIKMTDNPNDANFEYNAHTRVNTSKNVFYLGAYKGYSDNSKLRSWSGKTPTAEQTIGAFRTLAKANGASNGTGGSGYDQSGFYQLTFRQAMYLLKYKNLDSQTTIGRGYVNGNSAAIATGGTLTKGMDFGETTSKQQMKLFGLEDFWGNIYEWIDGIFSDSSRNILTATDGFNDTGSGYYNHGQGATADIGNYMSKPQGGTKTGFIAKEVSGSDSTYFCDCAYLYASRLAYFGGYWNNASIAGAFYLNVDLSASHAYSSIGARLMYL